MADEKTQTFELVDKPKEEPKVIGTTLEHAKNNGWSDKEIKKAEELGLIRKEEEKKEPKPEAKVEQKAEGKEPEVKEPEKKEEQKKEELKVKARDFELSPDQEKDFVKFFPPGTNTNGLYFANKAQRKRAQAAELERDRVLIEAKYKDQKLAELQERLEKIEKGSVKEEEGVDPEDQPLTPRQLKAMREAELKENQAKENEFKTTQEKISLAIRDQEEYAKEEYPDYEEVLKSGEQLVKDWKEGKLEGVAEKKAAYLIRTLNQAALQADKFSAKDYNVADISYELGKFAQSLNGQKTEPANNGNPAERKNGSLTPEQVDRVEKNASRRSSSASLSGSGGRRVVSVEDITLEDVNRMDSKTFEKFRKENPDKMKSLLRG